MQGSFKSEHKFEKRVELSGRLLKEYPDRIPVIVEAAHKSDFTIMKKKFLAPLDVSMGGFTNEIRKQIKISPTEAIFLFCDSGLLAPSSSTMGQVYEKCKDDDGFLYISVARENTFGGSIIGGIADIFDNILEKSSNIITAVCPF